MTQNLAIGFTEGLPITAPNSLQQFTLPMPQPQSGEVIVAVAGVSVNPVDTKRRQVAGKHQTPQIQGYDAVGTITQIGPMSPASSLVIASSMLVQHTVPAVISNIRQLMPAYSLPRQLMPQMPILLRCHLSV